MPAVEVYSGNFEDALATFKKKCRQEGVVGEYKRSLAFIPKHEERTQKAYRQERRRRKREGQ